MTTRKLWAGVLLAIVLLTCLPLAAQQPQTQQTPPAPRTHQPQSVEQTEPLALDDGRMWLCVLIAVGTAVCTYVLIGYSFGPKAGFHQTEARLVALYMIVVALVVEAVLICGILNVDTKRYEAIYAAIIGYVLGRLNRNEPGLPKKEKDKDKLKPLDPGLREEVEEI